MAKTFLQAVQQTLTRVNVATSTSVVGSFTVPGKQPFIDLAKQVWNELIDELFATQGNMKPLQAAETIVTLVADQRAYQLASDVVQLEFPLRDETNGTYIYEYPGGYERMIEVQAQPENHTGIPSYAAFNPTTGFLYLNTFPTATEAGRVYNYLYWKDTVLEDEDDEVPFGDAVFRAIVPATAEMWKRYQKKDFNQAVFDASMGRAVALLGRIRPRRYWLQRGRGVNCTDPMEPRSCR